MKKDILFLLFLVTILFSCNKSKEVTVVSQPTTDSVNSYYVGNKLPLLQSPLIKLPVGAIEPKGWLREKLIMQANGFHGHLEEISKFLQKENNAWLSSEGKGEYGWEEVPYWLKGYSNCAYILDDKDMIRKAEVWLNAAINSQQDDGWFGPGHGRTGLCTDLEGRSDLWPNMIMLFCLQDYYEFSGDERVIGLMTKYFKYLNSVPEEEFLVGFWPQMRAGDMLYSVYWLYNRTGEKWLLDFAKKTHKHTARWDLKVASWHNVNIAQGFREPAIWWMQSKNERDLQATERNWQEVRDLFGQVPGGMFGSDERCRTGYNDPRQAVETCGIVEEMLSDEILVQSTGDLKWADRCEDIAFNTLPAAFTPDMKALRYLTSPNMPQSDKESKAPGIRNKGPMFQMNPTIHRCCQHNGGHGWPYFAENLWSATPDNGLAAILYSANTVTAKVGNGTEITFTENTRYPFEENVVFTISTSQQVQFPLYLRIPGWCDNPQVSINGENVKMKASPRSYIKIDRTFNDGDKISLTLPMELSVKEWEHNKNSVSVNYGPLTFSLKIEEQKEQDGGTEEWPAWSIYPASSWNYGLVIDKGNPVQNFEIVKKEWPSSDIPFTLENTPIEIRTKGRKIPQWKLNKNGLVEELQQSPVYSSEQEETITLVPMGCAQIRISAFPTVSVNKEEAFEWKEMKNSEYER